MLSPDGETRGPCGLAHQENLDAQDRHLQGQPGHSPQGSKGRQRPELFSKRDAGKVMSYSHVGISPVRLLLERSQAARKCRPPTPRPGGMVSLSWSCPECIRNCASKAKATCSKLGLVWLLWIESLEWFPVEMVHKFVYKLEWGIGHGSNCEELNGPLRTSCRFPELFLWGCCMTNRGSSCFRYYRRCRFFFWETAPLLLLITNYITNSKCRRDEPHMPTKI